MHAVNESYQTSTTTDANAHTVSDTDPGSIRVVIADDHSLVRSAIAQWLRAEQDIVVLDEIGSADDAISACAHHAPDILLLDIDMPGRLAFDAVATIAVRSPSTRIIVLSAHTHDRYIQDAIDAEAAGYLTKREPPDQVVAAIRTVAEGGVAFSPEVRDRLIIAGDGVTLAGSRSRLSVLSPRELETLRYVARGMSKKTIAQHMHISVKTVDNHTTSLMGKLDVHDRVELTRFALREGLVEL